jgi:hypothetical protein
MLLFDRDEEKDVAVGVVQVKRGFKKTTVVAGTPVTRSLDTARNAAVHTLDFVYLL